MAQFSVEVKPFTNYDGDDPFVTQSRESVYVVFFWSFVQQGIERLLRREQSQRLSVKN
jgi:hypothetical protein